MSAGPFNESYKSPHIAPAFGVSGATEFDFEAVCRALGEPCDERDEALCMASDAIREILLHAVGGVNLSDDRALSQIGRRILCASIVIDRTIFPGNPSMAEIARRLGVTPPALSPFCAEFSRKFQFVSAGQSHDWRSQKYRKEKPIEQPATN